MTTTISNLPIFKRYLLGIRPKTLAASISPVIAAYGIAASVHIFRVGPAIAALICSLMIQSATNLINDVGDYQKGTDNAERIGPTRVTQSGLLTPRQVWYGVAGTLGIAILAGLYLAWVTGWQVLLIGAAAILAGFAYTTGPFPLSHNGLGDIFVLIFFGFVATCGSVYVLTGFIPSTSWPVALAVGALTVNILVVNNIRDMKTDQKAGRHNIPVVFGRGVGESEYILMLAIAYLACFFTVIILKTSILSLLPVISLPVAYSLYIQLHHAQTGPVFNQLLGKTGQLLLLFSSFASLGLIISSFLS
jgi:1,4-dihydroxy-2-naphthoate polyprenyltransferase